MGPRSFGDQCPVRVKASALQIRVVKQGFGEPVVKQCELQLSLSWSFEKLVVHDRSPIQEGTPEVLGLTPERLW
jgi:hypothetical protein